MAPPVAAQLSNPEKSVLLLNLDETSIVLNHDGQKGVVTSSADNRVVLVNKKSKQMGHFDTCRARM